ncbi:delta(24)-sterol reductase-like [Teratosphaeria destructans]|uniref:Delta(24)-sterol reductase-like n=1 Tax=Teratosphaeria destructans TaxID=418781 RepID=A0A9W7SYP0_9PEZI|nr:delta(24)-sterol reductase-like [Teratosphaeria destructans]
MWEVYDREWYEALRAKYGAGYLPTVYEKVRVDLSEGAHGRGWGAWVRDWVWGVWPVSGVYGVWKTLWETEYLVKRT